MSEIRFSPTTSYVPDYILNHKTESPFEKNNIRFRIGGNYLTDFTEKGVEKFINKYYNSKTGLFGWGGKDLELKDVMAFIQSVANNSSSLKGAVFDLTDPDLGLFNDDKITAEHIKSGFTIKTPSSNLPSQGVTFFDAENVIFDLKQAREIEIKAKEAMEKFKKSYEQAQNDLKYAQAERQSMIDFLGKDAPNELAQKETRILKAQEELDSLVKERASYIAQIEELSKNPQANQALITALKRAVTGTDYEIDLRDKEIKKLNKEITEKHGPLSFIGIGESLSGLREDNKKVASAQSKVDQAYKNYLEAQQAYLKAKEIRQRIESGESFYTPPQGNNNSSQTQQPTVEQPTNINVTYNGKPVTPQFFAQLSLGDRATVLSSISDKDTQQVYIKTLSDVDRINMINLVQERMVKLQKVGPELGLDPQTIVTQIQQYQKLLEVLKPMTPTSSDNVLMFNGNPITPQGFTNFGPEDKATILTSSNNVELINSFLQLVSETERAKIKAIAQQRIKNLQEMGSSLGFDPYTINNQIQRYNNLLGLLSTTTAPYREEVVNNQNNTVKPVNQSQEITNITESDVKWALELKNKVENEGYEPTQSEIIRFNKIAQKLQEQQSSSNYVKEPVVTKPVEPVIIKFEEDKNTSDPVIVKPVEDKPKDIKVEQPVNHSQDITELTESKDQPVVNKPVEANNTSSISIDPEKPVLLSDRPIYIEGGPVTIDNFKNLDPRIQLAVLIDCDTEYLEPLLMTLDSTQRETLKKILETELNNKTKLPDQDERERLEKEKKIKEVQKKLLEIIELEKKNNLPKVVNQEKKVEQPKVVIEQPVEKPKYRIYNVNPNESIWQIALKELGSAKRWNEILQLNRDVIDTTKNPWVLPEQLKLPLK